MPADLVCSCAIFGCDLYVLTGNNMLDGVTAGGSEQTSTNPSDGKIFIFRKVVPCGGYCDKAIE